MHSSYPAFNGFNVGQYVKWADELIMCSECSFRAKPSTKQDVFSFGVVLLELVSGKPALLTETETEKSPEDLATWVVRMMSSEGDIDKVIDSELRETDHLLRSQMENTIHTTIVCTRIAPKMRPSMRRVVDRLCLFNQMQKYKMLP
eukprot:Gb_00407 [translate_table: standard]